jgi:hypothetical protein
MDEQVHETHWRAGLVFLAAMAPVLLTAEGGGCGRHISTLYIIPNGQGRVDVTVGFVASDVVTYTCSTEPLRPGGADAPTVMVPVTGGMACSYDVDTGEVVSIAPHLSMGSTLGGITSELDPCPGGFGCAHIPVNGVVGTMPSVPVVVTVTFVSSQPGPDPMVSSSLVAIPSASVNAGAQVTLTVQIPASAPTGLTYNWYSDPAASCTGASAASTPMASANGQSMVVTPQVTTAYRADVVSSAGAVVSSASVTVCVTPNQTPHHTLTIAIDGPGGVTVEGQAQGCSDHCSFDVPITTTEVKMSAEGTGLHSFFNGWSGCQVTPVPGEVGAVMVTMDSDHTCTATFHDCTTPPARPTAAFSVTIANDSILLDASASSGMVDQYRWSFSWPGATPITTHNPMTSVMPLPPAPLSNWRVTLELVDVCGSPSTNVTKPLM